MIKVMRIAALILVASCGGCLQPREATSVHEYYFRYEGACQRLSDRISSRSRTGGWRERLLEAAPLYAEFLSEMGELRQELRKLQCDEDSHKLKLLVLDLLESEIRVNSGIVLLLTSSEPKETIRKQFGARIEELVEIRTNKLGRIYEELGLKNGRRLP